jgi:hypothetical protein
MNSQNLILLGIGAFVALIVAAVAVDQAFLAKNDPMDPAGLLARAETAFQRVEDLELVLNVVSTGNEGNPVRMRVWYIGGTDPAVRILYLAPTQLKGEIYTVDRDLLSHYIPQQNMTVIKRWAGFPLSELGFARFDLQDIKQQWKQGKVTLRVSQNIPSFNMQLFPNDLVVTESLAGLTQWTNYSLACGDQYTSGLSISAAGSVDNNDLSPIPGGFVLRVYDKQTGQLTKMVSIDRDTYLVEQIVLFTDEKRTTTIYASQLILNQSLNRDQLLILPRGTEIIRG